MLRGRFVLIAEDDIVGQPGGRDEGEAAQDEPGPDQPGIMFGLNDDIRQEPHEPGGDRPENAEN